MSWVVDTCVLIDVLEDDPDFGHASALCLKKYLSEGVVLSPVSMIELSPAFEGNLSKQKDFLSLCGVGYEAVMEAADLSRAHASWNHYIQKKRLGKAIKRPLADIMIGAFASRFDGLITRNPKDFRPWFPHLHLVVPTDIDD
jgi:predicted nucleic acid-binding protein